MKPEDAFVSDALYTAARSGCRQYAVFGQEGGVFIPDGVAVYEITAVPKNKISAGTRLIVCDPTDKLWKDILIYSGFEPVSFLFSICHI
ncbi:MAG: hypothetical protein MJ177_01510 [Clostridia bacterium]|nr:hypothetical protein [Clostridia bacterium]